MTSNYIFRTIIPEKKFLGYVVRKGMYSIETHGIHDNVFIIEGDQQLAESVVNQLNRAYDWGFTVANSSNAHRNSEACW